MDALHLSYSRVALCVAGASVDSFTVLMLRWSTWMYESIMHELLITVHEIVKSLYYLFDLVSNHVIQMSLG